MSNYTSILHIRLTGQKVESITLFVHSIFDSKVIKRGNICNNNIKHQKGAKLRNKGNNIIFSCICRPLRGNSQFLF